jgi:hypothetical protein
MVEALAVEIAEWFVSGSSSFSESSQAFFISSVMMVVGTKASGSAEVAAGSLTRPKMLLPKDGTSVAAELRLER